MTENGDPLENAIAERVNGILKTEWIDKQHFKSWEDAQGYVKRVILLYNTERPHQSIGYLTPEQVHKTGITTERKWKNYYLQNKGEETFQNALCDSKSKAMSEQRTNSSESVNLR
jgi:hypothetical protein